MDDKNILKREIENKGCTYEWLAEKTGLSASTIQRYASGQTSKIPISAIKKIADALNIHVGVIMGFSEADSSLNKVVYLPVVDHLRVGPNGIEEVSHVGTEPVAGYSNMSEYRLIKITGNEMSPLLMYGDIAIVHLEKELRTDDIAVVLIGNDEIFIGRVYIHNDLYIFETANADFPIRIFSKDEMNDITIYGRIVETKRKY